MTTMPISVLNLLGELFHSLAWSQCQYPFPGLAWFIMMGTAVANQRIHSMHCRRAVLDTPPSIFTVALLFVCAGVTVDLWRWAICVPLSMVADTIVRRSLASEAWVRRAKRLLTAWDKKLARAGLTPAEESLMLIGLGTTAGQHPFPCEKAAELFARGLWERLTPRFKETIDHQLAQEPLEKRAEILGRLRVAIEESGNDLPEEFKAMLAEKLREIERQVYGEEGADGAQD